MRGRMALDAGDLSARHIGVADEKEKGQVMTPAPKYIHHPV